MQNPAGVQPGSLIKPPELPDDVVEEILARFPPDEPALLVRAALACKCWCRIVSSAGFRRRFHRAAPLLGFFYHTCGQPAARFDPTSPFRPPHAARADWFILNGRHGRFLVLERKSTTTSSATPPSMEAEFVVWDATTDEQHRVPMPPSKYSTWDAILLCAAAGCDHFDCPRGPFLVVFVFTDVTKKGTMSASVYSSEQGAWREPISVHWPRHDWRSSQRFDARRSNVLLKDDAIYFGCDRNFCVVEYDLGNQELSMISLPRVCYWKDVVLLMTAEGGRLGLATVEKAKLCLWSREAGSGGDATWAQQRVMELDKMLPNPHPVHHVDFYPVAIADDLGVVFILAKHGLFTIDLRSSRAKKIGDLTFTGGIGPHTNYYIIVPYTNFYCSTLLVRYAGERASWECGEKHGHALDSGDA